MLQKGVGPATTALEKLAEVTTAVTSRLPGAKGVTTGAGAPGAVTGTLTGVNAQLADAVAKATAEYKQLTGKTATITSGVREREKQERMYNEWVAGGKKGKPVAPPGSSKHETGNAVDINQADADAMARMGILQKYGLNRPVANDPVHIELAKTSGPSSGYKSTDMANPASTLSPMDSAQARYNAQNSQSEEFVARMGDRLEEQIRLQREANDIARSTNRAVK